MRKFRRGRSKDRQNGGSDVDSSVEISSEPSASTPSVLDLDKAYADTPSLPPRKEPEDDFGTYRRIREALEPNRLRSALVRMRSEVGTLGFSTQNGISKLSHEGIARIVAGEHDVADDILADAERAWHEFKSNEHHLPKAGRTQFGNNAAQELVELVLFKYKLPVLRGDLDEMPELPHILSFTRRGIHIQAVLAGYKDVVSELSKAILEITADEAVGPERRLELNRRWLRYAESTVLVLEEFKGLPNSVTQNFFGSRRSWSDGMRWLRNLIIKNRKHYEDLLNQKQLMDDFLRRIGASDS